MIVLSLKSTQNEEAMAHEDEGAVQGNFALDVNSLGRGPCKALVAQEAKTQATSAGTGSLQLGVRILARRQPPAERTALHGRPHQFFTSKKTLIRTEHLFPKLSATVRWM